MPNHLDEIVDSICFWCDMLGYGAPFVESGWNLHDYRCVRNFERLDQLHELFTTTASPHFVGTKLVFNDGFAHTMDCAPKSLNEYSRILSYLEGVFNDYDRMSYIETSSGFPGLRGVISCGHRYSRSRVNLTEVSPLDKVFAYYPHVFQMNTAFSKAFLMEESGSRANLKGPALYIDADVLRMLASCAHEVGAAPPKVSSEGKEMCVSAFYGLEERSWFGDIRVFREPYPYGDSLQYENRGIVTTLYRYVDSSVRSRIDEYSRLGTFAQSVRVSRIDDEKNDW